MGERNSCYLVTKMKFKKMPKLETVHALKLEKVLIKFVPTGRAAVYGSRSFSLCAVLKTKLVLL